MSTLEEGLDFKSQQEITEILENYRSKPSNSNKYRFELFAYINEEIRKAKIEELKRIKNFYSDNDDLRGTDEYADNRITQLRGDK